MFFCDSSGYAEAVENVIKHALAVMLSPVERSRSISAASLRPFNEAIEMLRLRCATLSMTKKRLPKQLLRNMFLFCSASVRAAQHDKKLRAAPTKKPALAPRLQNQGRFGKSALGAKTGSAHPAAPASARPAGRWSR